MVPFQRPSLPSNEHIAHYFELSRQGNWYSNDGPCCRLLASRLEDRGNAYCIPVASGTAGLIVAIAALRHLQRIPSTSAGASAYLPSFTFPATAQAALWNGLTPHLGDIAADHWHLDPNLLDSAIHHNPSLSLIIAVSTFGTPPPPDIRHAWEYASRDHRLPLVIDSAAGFGAYARDGLAIGGQGDIEVVSFHATKPMAVGEGGAVFTRDAAVRDTVAQLINFGLAPNRQDALPLGLNAKLSELSAATALASLDTLDSHLQQRRRHAATLRASATTAIGWQTECELSTWQFLPLALPTPAHRDALVGRSNAIVDVRSYYRPLHLHHLLTPHLYAPDALPATDSLYSRILCFPMAVDLTSQEIAICKSLLATAGSSPTAPRGADSVSTSPTRP